ncbi:MAG: hypothetical protein IJN16_10085 [Lachnospiraceae bacterium]|nr:hypothetical protein [Lachnospiraceae bacterium]
MKSLPWKKTWFRVLLGILTVISLRDVIPWSEKGMLAITNSMLVPIAILVFVAGWFWMVKKEKWDDRSTELLNGCFFFGILFWGAMVFGTELDVAERVTFSAWSKYISVLVLAVAGAPLMAWCMVKISDLSKREKSNVTTSAALDKKYFLRVMLLLLLAYIPVLLASWPGFFTYDAEVESHMSLTDTYSAHHPIAHVLLLGFCLKAAFKIFHTYNAGIAIYMLVQMTVISFCFSYMLCTLKRFGVRKWILNVSLAFLALFPTVSMFVCCSTKDGYFCAGLVLLTTLLLEMALEGVTFWQDKWKLWLLFAAVLIVLLFRNNGIYAFVVFLPFFAWMYKGYWKRWGKVVAGALVFFVLFNEVTTFLFKVTPGEKAEMLCVPMQQLARVHEEARECFDQEDLEFMHALIPEEILATYNPKLADNIKYKFDDAVFEANVGKFFSMWLRIGVKRPDIYVNSWLMNTYGYWYPDTILDGYRGRWIVDREYKDSSYFAFTTERPGIRNSLLPVLEGFYEKISLEIYQQKIPVLSMLFSIGFWHWVYLFLAFYLWKLGPRKQLLTLLPMGIVYLTVLLGPIAIVRYVLYFFFCAPIVLALLFDNRVLSEK